MGLLSRLTGLFGTSPPRKNTVRVEFVNESDNSMFAVSEMLPEQLPESFLIDTTLELQGDRWSVVSAEPVQKAEFIKTGSLRVVLAKISTLSSVDVQNLLYSLPTISDELPSITGDMLPHSGLYSLHEDDWRQIEFVSETLGDVVDREIAEIGKIHQDERGDGGIGFKNVHVRKHISQPLPDAGLSMDAIREAFPPQKEYEALSFHRTRGIIPGSFAWTTRQQVDVWGQQQNDGTVAVLCLSGVPSAATLQEWCTSLTVFAEQNRLFLVDWCRMTKLDGQPDKARRYYEELSSQ